MTIRFHLIDRELLPSTDSLRRPWTIFEVRIGHSTDWNLCLELEREGQVAKAVFERPETFRVQDESDIAHYWGLLSAQQAEIGTFYVLKEGAFLEEFRARSIWPDRQLQHFLVAALDTCVEVICARPPRVEITEG